MILDHLYCYVVDYTGLPTMGKHYGHTSWILYCLYINNKPPYSKLKLLLLSKFYSMHHVAMQVAITAPLCGKTK